MTLFEKLSYKMENDNVSAGAAVGGIGAGLYAAGKQKAMKDVVGKSALKGAIRGAGIGAGLGLVGGVINKKIISMLTKDLPDDLRDIMPRFSVPKAVALSAGQKGAIGAGAGYYKGNKALKVLRSKRNAALAIAALLGAGALATKEAKEIDRWENAKIQGTGGAVLGGGAGAVGGGVVGGLIARENPQLRGLLEILHIKKPGLLKKLLRSTHGTRYALGGAALGAALGGLAGGASSATTGYVSGAGVDSNSSVRAYAENQGKRHAVLGGIAGGAAGLLVGGPMAVPYFAVGSAINSGLNGALTGAVGKKIKGD